MTVCEKCGTDHDGFEPETLGAEIRCLAARAAALGDPEAVVAVDMLRTVVDTARDEALREEGLIP